MTGELPRVRPLQCCCCGAALRGRQWFNRDTGYGICDRCADDEAARSDPADMRSRYGVAGVHYKVPAS